MLEKQLEGAWENHTVDYEPVIKSAERVLEKQLEGAWEKLPEQSSALAVPCVRACCRTWVAIVSLLEEKTQRFEDALVARTARTPARRQFLSLLKHRFGIVRALVASALAINLEVVRQDARSAISPALLVLLESLLSLLSKGEFEKAEQRAALFFGSAAARPLFGTTPTGDLSL
ncbi:hypothetical protein T484DRAFT_1888978 [Baffinella frigidus]|nr:hypothetical protein T484DRAFT_1888978 [Cryptophyta sp. CCMP2293]